MSISGEANTIHVEFDADVPVSLPSAAKSSHEQPRFSVRPMTPQEESGRTYATVLGYLLDMLSMYVQYEAFNATYTVLKRHCAEAIASAM